MEGVATAVRRAQEAARTVPAYQDVLAQRNVSPLIRTAEDFVKLPIIEKKGYISNYALADLFPKRVIPEMAYASSGSTGKPTFWFRNTEQEEAGGEIHERIFRDMYRFREKDRVLVVVCFAMGVWIAGAYTMASTRYLARTKGYGITTVTPGIEQEDILHILSTLAPAFEHVVLAGYPPFLMDVFSAAAKKGIALPHSLRVLTAGDKSSEEWRKDMCELAGLSDTRHDVCSVYGSADAGVIGHETPLSISIRQAALENSALFADLFGGERVLPGLYQYDPDHVYLEEVHGEVVLTTGTAAPLIRYNIHDLGRVIPYEEMTRLLQRHRITGEEREMWKLPFVLLRGRSDVAVTFYALNILPEHIEAGLLDERISSHVSGKFIAYNTLEEKSTIERLFFELELVPGAEAGEELERLASQCLTDALLEWNIEFRKLHETIHERALPRVILHKAGSETFGLSRQGLHGVRGKKPRMIS